MNRNRTITSHKGHGANHNMDVNFFFLLFSSIIIIGFLSSILFKITKIPSTIILISMGVLIGPVLGLIDTAEWQKIASYFGTLALILILLEGGLELEIQELLEQLGFAFLLGLIIFCLSIFSLSLYFTLLLGYPLPFAMLMGAILSGTSPAIVFPTLSKLNIGKDFRTLLNLESTIAELLCVISVIIILQFIDYNTGVSAFSAEASPLLVFSTFLKETGIALLFAIVTGVIWTRILALFGERSLGYIITLGITIFLFSITELCGGKGALAVLFFGIFLTNATWFVAQINRKMQKYTHHFHIPEESFLISEKISHTNIEFAFLIRTFFFVYLGVFLNYKLITLKSALNILLIMAMILLIRFIVFKIVKKFSPTLKENFLTICIASMPRGLINAVLAFTVITTFNEKFHLLEINMPLVNEINNTIFGVVFLSNIFMALLVFYYEHFQAQKETKPLENEVKN